MKLRATIGAAVLIAGAGLYFWFGAPEDTGNWETQKRLLKKNARGTADDPIARERWEFERLKDPTTGSIPRGIRAKELEFAATLPTKETMAREALAKGQQAQVFSWVKRGPHNVGGRTRALAVDVTNTNTILAGGVSGGMWRSTDDGATWVKTTGTADIQSVTTIAQDTRSGKEATWYYGTGEGTGNSASKSGAFFNGAGAFKSTNGGVSWTALTSTVGSSPVGPIDNFFDIVWRIVTDPSNSTEDEVYAATILGIQRSTNGGTSWTTVRGAFANAGPYFTDVAVTSTGVVYAALSAQALDGSFNGTNKGIWRSTDGVTWTLISSGVSGFPTNYSRIVMAIAPSNQNAVYFLIEGTNGTNGTNQINDHQLWKYTYGSGDGSGAGGTWVNRGQNLPNETGLSGNAVFSTQNSYDMHLAVKPDDENFLLVGGVNLYRSTDGFATGSNWKRIGGYATKDTYSSYANQHADQHSGVFRPGSSLVFYSGHDGGISKTTDITATTVSWTHLNNGYLTTQFYALAIDRATNGNSVIIGGTQDNGTWFTNNSNATSAWPSLFGGDGAFCAIADGRTSYYVSSQNGNMYRLILDANGNWGASNTWANIQPTGGANYLFINPFVLDPNNTNMMYLGGGDRVWRNTDLTAITTGVDNTTSTNWTAFTNAILPQGGSGERVTALAVSKGGTANRLFIGSNAASVYRIDNANTGNPTLTDMTPLNFPGSGNIGCVAVNPSDADEVVAVFTNYGIPSLFASTNGGTTWTDVGGNLEQNPNGTGNGPSCRWVVIVPTVQGKYYFAATSTGLYSTSTLNGASTVWAQEGSSVIGNVIVDMIDARPSDGLVVVGTHGNGVFSSNIIVSAPTAGSGIPESFHLGQNFPNPFNPSTTIQYSLPERAKIRITVFDLAGREVAVLADREQERGIHTVQWNARDAQNRPVSSGVYFYRMTAVGEGNRELFSQTERMTFVK